MSTYIIIGIIVSLLIRIERSFRIHDMWNQDWTSWVTWLILLVGMVLDAIIWPLAIVCEIYLVIRDN